MVKNIFGGNKHKSQARKNTVKSSNKLRVAQDEGELYAIVTKMNGNGMFNAHCIDDISRLCQIRGKFRGRGKRDNIVEIGKWVLVGEREWDIKTTEDKKDKKLKCDLLEVYSELDKEKLIDTVSMNWSILTSKEITKKELLLSADDPDITFATERDEECEKLMAEINANKTTAIDLNIKTDEKMSETFWINDI